MPAAVEAGVPASGGLPPDALSPGVAQELRGFGAAKRGRMSART